jgi:adenine-specific DNA-methyltransferase
LEAPLAKKTQHGKVRNGVGSGAATKGTSSARIKSAETKEVAALSPVEELEKIRQRLAELEHGQKLGLVWRDIPEDVETRLRDEMPVLIHEKELDVSGSVPSDQAHILVEGDNLHALHVLQATHRNRIDVIYIDPPYNTGNEFIYNDSIIDKENPWRHSAWLSFISKRLVLARPLLADNGVILISIGEDEFAYLKVLCDKIFGGSNFITMFIWEKTQHFGRQKVNYYSNADFILAYAKNLQESGVSQQQRRKRELLVEFVKSELEDAPLFNKSNKVTTLRFPPGKVKFNIPDGIYKSTTDDKYKLTTPVRVEDSENVNDLVLRFKSRWSQEFVDKELAQGTTFWVKTENFAIRAIYGDGRASRESPKQLLFTNSSNSFVATNRFGVRVGNQESATAELASLIGEDSGFPYPKPKSLLTYLLSMYFSSDEGFRKNFTVLDFFAGSGTTLHAVAELNALDGGSRRCILVTNNENEICREVTHPRIKAVLTGEWADGENHDPLPGSLVFYRTGFVKRSKSPDRMRAEIAKHTVDLIAVKEGTVRTLSRNTAMTLLKGSGKTIAVAPGLDPDHADLRKTAEKKVEEGDRRVVYLFTWSDNGVEEEVAALWSGWEVNPLPAEMLAALRRIAPPARLFDDHGGAS